MADPIASMPKGLNRPSKFSQTLSSLKAIIHRKTKDDNAVANKNPYSAQSRQDSKLHMSQPILVLSNPNRPNIDADDVSSSPDRSSPLNIYPTPPILGHAHKVSTASNSSNSFNDHDGAIKTQPNGGAASVCSLATSGTCDDSIPNSLKPAGVKGLVKPTHVGLAFEKSPLTAPSELLQVPLAPAVPLSLSSASSGDTITPNVQAPTSAPKFNKFYTSAEPPVLLLYSSTPTLSLDSLAVTNDGRKGIGSSKRDSDSPLTPPSSVRDVSRRVPKLTLDTTLSVNNDINNDSIINTSAQQHLFTPIQPRRTVSSAPRRSLPPANYRFSLNLVNGYSGRPSPSVTLPTLPLPIGRLVSPGGTSMDAVSSRRAKRAGLMSMPALPRQGSSKGTAGREELDDEDDEDGDGTDDDDSTSANSTSTEDEMEPESSGDCSTSETIPSNRSHLRSPSTSSCETELSATPHVQDGYFGDLSRPLERRFSRSPRLPSVDISRIDLSFLDSSQPNDNKGKSKELTEDTLKTPIAKRPNLNKNGGTAGNSTPTAFRRMDFFIPEETATDTWPPSTQRPPRSPIQTPRPGCRFNLPPPVSIPPSPRPINMRSTTENQSSGSMNTISQFPGTYKRASRSLIDVHALETKEKVEQMVREEEENAEEERKRRVKSMRMSTIIVVEDADVPTTPLDQKSGHRQSQMLTVSSRIPLASVDGEDLEVSSAKKQAKRASKRISMAPAYDTIIPLRKRLSMPTFNSTSTAPPPYPDLFPGSGLKFTQVQPREDEGRERLPLYSNAIYLKAVMPRKLEFTGPGIQAKDRKWKRVLCVLEGTSFKVYKPPGVSALEGWWESKVGIGDLAMQVTTNSSFNSGGVRVENAIEESKAEVERERERMREATAMANQSQFDDTTPSNQRQGSSSAASGSTSILPAALNVAVHLLIPSSRGHGRTISDVGQPSHTSPVRRLPRTSLDIPRNGRSTPAPTIASTTSLSSSRSPSPAFASSSSLMSTSASSSSSHPSMNSTSIAAGGGHRSDNYPSSTSRGKQRMAHSDLLPKENTLIKAYTMQHAESGLGTDYVKRKHVIRVRLEGEQFLLQAGNVDSVVEWIEGLQAATNIAMDLDERPMPRGPLFPRRRRRRRPDIPSLIAANGNQPVDPLQLGPPLPIL